MAMSKKTFMAVIIFSIVLLSLAIHQNMIAKADTSSSGGGSTWSTTITIISPSNLTDYINPVILNFSIEADLCFMGYFGDVGVSIDGGSTIAVTNFTSYVSGPSFADWYTKQINVTANIVLPNLAVGTHSVDVYTSNEPIIFAHANVDFMVKNLVISSLSINNQTYASNEIPLFVSVEGIPSRIGYSLDNLANTTLNGNTTLTGLTNGSHSIVLYANDTAGNADESETIFFSVNTPTPSPSPSPIHLFTPSPTQVPSTILSPTPSSSSTQQPTLETSPTASSIPFRETGNPNLSLDIIAIVAILVIVGAGLLVYLRRTKK
jgi:hypothetical protein